MANIDERVKLYLEFLSGLPKYTPIEVEWEDASESDLYYIPKSVESLKNIAVETRQHEIGWFLGVRKGRKWKTPHLIFVIRRVDGGVEKSAISSIPLSLVHKVRVLSSIDERKAKKVLDEILVPAKKWRRKTIKFQDGVKKLR